MDSAALRPGRSQLCPRLPPVFVQRHTMRVIDGMHRRHAAISRGTTSIEVRFVDREDTDAFLLQVLANVSHGMPLSLADRKAATVRSAHPSTGRIVRSPGW